MFGRLKIDDTTLIQVFIKHCDIIDDRLVSLS